jgi:valyl-tRNA synthetase
VNQLFWQDREIFDELLAAGERLRAGDLAATSAHRDAMVKLRARAEVLLAAAGHASTEAMLRRIMTDLSALAAAGSFDPDPPGALSGDREPPVCLAALEAAPPADTHKRAPRDGKEDADGKRTKEADARRERQEREQLERERRKAEAERAKKRAERERLEKSLRSAKAELQTHKHHVDRLQSELAKAEKTVAQTEDAIAELESRLAGRE